MVPPIKGLEDIELTPEQRKNIEKAKEDLDKQKNKAMVEDFKNNVRKNPILRESGVIAVNQAKYTFFKVFTFLTFIVIVLGLSFLIYGTYTGNFKSVLNATQICGQVNLTCEKQECNPSMNCPIAPACVCNFPDIDINIANNTVKTVNCSNYTS